MSMHIAWPVALHASPSSLRCASHRIYSWKMPFKEAKDRWKCSHGQEVDQDCQWLLNQTCSHRKSRNDFNQILNVNTSRALRLHTLAIFAILADDWNAVCFYLNSGMTTPIPDQQWAQRSKDAQGKPSKYTHRLHRSWAEIQSQLHWNACPMHIYFWLNSVASSAHTSEFLLWKAACILAKASCINHAFCHMMFAFSMTQQGLIWWRS